MKNKKHFPPSPLTIFTIISGICSILGVVLLCFRTDVSAILALCLCSGFLLLVLIEITIAIIGVMKIENNNDGYRVNFDYICYQEDSDTLHSYDSYKAIQAKRPYLNSIWHNYDWSGTNKPELSSTLQKLGRDKAGNKNAIDPEERMDKKELIFHTPLLYNQVTTAHFHATMNDSDMKSEPCVSYKINGPISFILFKVTLLNRKPEFEDEASLYKVPLSEKLNMKKHYMEPVTFNKITKSYTYPLISPEPGYTYYLYWKKNK